MKCELCNGKMRKSTSPFGYVTWRCEECGNEDIANKLFQKLTGKKQWVNIVKI